MPAAMTMLADHPARQLLDFSQKLDITLLDNVVNSMYHDIGSQVKSFLSAVVFIFSTLPVTLQDVPGRPSLRETEIFFTHATVSSRKPTGNIK